MIVTKLFTLLDMYTMYNDSMVTIKVRKDMLSRYAKYVYCNYSHVRICKHVRSTNVLLARFEADGPNHVHFVCKIRLSSILIAKSIS